MGVELEELTRIARQEDYSSFFSACKDRVSQDQLFGLLAAEQACLYKIIYAKYTMQQLVHLATLLPDLNPDPNLMPQRYREIFKQYPDVQDQLAIRIHNLILFPPYDGTTADCDSIESLILVTRQMYEDKNPTKAKSMLGELFLRAPDLVCKKPGMGSLAVLMSPNYFMTFLHKQPYDILPSIFCAGAELYNVLMMHGSAALSCIFKCFTDRDYSRLKNVLVKNDGSLPLYEKIIKCPGGHHAEVISLIQDTIKDRDKKRILLNYYANISPDVFLSLLKSMSVPARREALLTRMTDFMQTYLIEKFAVDIKDNIKLFFELLLLFEDPKDRFEIFAQPIKYAVRKVYAKNEMANAAVSTLSSFASMIPGVGRQAASMVDSIQGEEDISEFLISRIVRANPLLEKNIPELLFELDPEQHSLLLREPDSTSLSLLERVLIHSKKEEILHVLSNVAYVSSEQKKFLDPKMIDLERLRGALRHHEDCNARVGFIAYLGFYNYIRVRSTESGRETYLESESEFIELMKSLLKNKSGVNILNVFNEHCRNNQLREAWGTQTVKIGTNRHLEARNKMGALTSSEMLDGMKMFAEFIKEQLSNTSFLNRSSLDFRLNEIFNPVPEDPRILQLYDFV